MDQCSDFIQPFRFPLAWQTRTPFCLQEEVQTENPMSSYPRAPLFTSIHNAYNEERTYTVLMLTSSSPKGGHQPSPWVIGTMRLSAADLVCALVVSLHIWSLPISYEYWLACKRTFCTSGSFIHSSTIVARILRHREQGARSLAWADWDFVH